MELILETAGESHGPTLSAILVGIPTGSPVSEAFINARLRLRQGGRGASPRQLTEKDEVAFSAGIRDGFATGNPIALQVGNRDQKYKDLPPVHNPRPGHADLAGALNRGLTDARDVVERSSARETAVRVAAGAVAAEFLEALGIKVLGHVVTIGDVRVYGRPPEDLNIARVGRDGSELHALGTPVGHDAAIHSIDEAKREGDTLGGIIEVVATGVPPGLGGHERPETKLSARLAATLMGIQAVRGVELGMGFAMSALPGSKVHDAILPAEGDSHIPTRGSNSAGGIEGGTSNGQPIVVRAAMKPLATTMRGQPSVDLRTGKAVQGRVERSDVTAVPRLAVVAEMAVALELARQVRRRFGGAHIDEVRAAMASHTARINEILGADAE